MFSRSRERNLRDKNTDKRNSTDLDKLLESKNSELIDMAINIKEGLSNHIKENNIDEEKPNKILSNLDDVVIKTDSFHKFQIQLQTAITSYHVNLIKKLDNQIDEVPNEVNITPSLPNLNKNRIENPYPEKLPGSFDPVFVNPITIDNFKSPAPKIPNLKAPFTSIKKTAAPATKTQTPIPKTSIPKEKLETENRSKYNPPKLIAKSPFNV